MQAIEYGKMTESSDWEPISGKRLYLNDQEDTYLFEIIGGETIKRLDYNYAGDPFEVNPSTGERVAPWEVHRPEPLPPGNIGGAGTIILEPFSLMWFQNNKLQCWGVIPKSGSNATVKQVTTDLAGDFVESIVTKIVP